ncbi:MAG: bifunctional folylpolyglutamate synthase/dihydrofolate synthase [Treponema sp.]|jgi:dihydrofolate synthase/folylpolyglutamate synthase|nr:bifunctional folylpolyglutamate synthase/dihydrofolate synthase [Treponema sp.]
MQFLSSSEVFSWLSKFINLERGQKPKSFRLDRMEFLTSLAGNPERCAPSIHVAGSKGKGSVTGMITAILTAAGFRVARYMSPHVIDIRERICLGDSYFSEEVYCAAGNELREIVERKLPAAVSQASLQASQQAAGQTSAALFDPEMPDGCEPTFWELLTLLFFLCAKHGNCNVMVVETGMGGRLDSTNILDPLVSVITLIELEHTGILGDTLAAVAGEKAGIIKQGKPVVLAKQNKEALEVFRLKVEEKNSPLLYLPEIAKITDVEITTQGTNFSIETVSIPFHIPIPGKVQAENAALAITAVKTAFPQLNTANGEEAIRRGLASLRLPARFEKCELRPPVTFIIDGAHTPESLTFCIETFCLLYGDGGVLVFGCASDKDTAAMAEIAHSRFSKIIITTPGTFKISDPASVYKAFVVFGSEKTQLVLDTQEAVKQAIEFAQENHLPILGTGSFYLVSEIRKILN